MPPEDGELICVFSCWNDDRINAVTHDQQAFALAVSVPVVPPQSSVVLISTLRVAVHPRPSIPEVPCPTSEAVDASGYRFKVNRIAADALAAHMVDVETRRDRP